MNEDIGRRKAREAPPRRASESMHTALPTPPLNMVIKGGSTLLNPQALEMEVGTKGETQRACSGDTAAAAEACDARQKT